MSSAVEIVKDVPAARFTVEDLHRSIRDAVAEELLRDDELQPVTRVVTVRMHRDLHSDLKDVSGDNRVSINKLCLVAIEQLVAALRPTAPDPSPPISTEAGHGPL